VRKKSCSFKSFYMNEWGSRLKKRKRTGKWDPLGQGKGPCSAFGQPTTPIFTPARPSPHEGKLISSPVGLICYMCVFLRYWAGLQEEKDKKLLLEGASRLQRGAMAAHEMARQRMPRARIQEDVDEDEEVSV
jgi:hypothetical protein